MGDQSRYVAEVLNPKMEEYFETYQKASDVYIIYDVSRFCLLCALIVLGTGGVVQILRKYKVNYVHIFNIQPYF